MPDTTIALFVKYPEPGKVKTRLAASIGDEASAELARAFAEDVLAALDEGKYETVVCFEPREKEAEFKQWLGPNRKYLAQDGENLGERMKNAMEKLFSVGCEKVAVLGTDVPDIDRKAINQADDSLRRYGTSVIGPAGDGGYFLIGFAKDDYLPEIFNGVDWGSDQVFQQTLAICGDHGSIPVFLPGRDDVDDEKGLKALYERTKETNFTASQTFPLLKKLYG